MGKYEHPPPKMRLIFQGRMGIGNLRLHGAPRFVLLTQNGIQVRLTANTRGE
jgi:hypothetical protein